MSTTYYLRHKKKYEEYQGFEKFWDELIAKTKESIDGYCRKVDGWLVNADLAEDIIASTTRISAPGRQGDLCSDRATLKASVSIIYRNLRRFLKRKKQRSM